ncbi:MAG: FAD-dependent oxidoreductase [Clostridiales bacterium]|nr:FAD-dependent oxidoreductase [Clostridiales bacterium]
MTDNANKQILIIGGVAGGASVAARMRRLDEHADITMLERGRDVSFSNCALPYFLGGEIADSDTLKLMDPQTFWDSYRVRALTHHEALAINRAEKTVQVKNLQTGEMLDLSYDTLFLSPGASPILPPAIPGIRLPHVFSVRNVEDVEGIARYLSEQKVQKVAVIGGGFIGIEVMENLVEKGLKVSVIDMAPQVMLPFDQDMAQFLHKEIIDHGVELILDDCLDSIQEDGVTLRSGRQVPAQAVIMAIGVRPEIGLAQDAGLTIGDTGTIAVNQMMQTSDPAIFAVGDAVEVSHFQTRQKTKLALAGPALKQGRVAANTATGHPELVPGVLGASVLRVFSLNAASVGLNERQCQAEGLKYQVAFVVPTDKVGIMPGASPVFFKLIYETGSSLVLGAQAVGQGAVDKRIDVIATLLRFKGSIVDLKDLELCYSPVFGTARDVVNMAGLAACNLSDGLVRQVMFTDIRRLVEEGAVIIDVREEDEYALGHIKGAINIPLSRLRDRLEDIPRDVPLYLHCRSGQRSYNAARALMQRGFREVYNIAGSFVALSWYEYYTDRTLGREPIVTAYNFE